MPVPVIHQHLGDIVSTTLSEIRPVIHDNVYKSMPLLFRLLQRNRVLYSGGSDIRVPFIYDKPPAGWHRRGQDLNIARKEQFSTLVFDYGMYYSAVTVDGLDELQNSGAWKVIDLVAARMQSAHLAIRDSIATDLFGDGAESSPAGGPVVGLKAAVDDGSLVPVYGRIQRATSGPGAYIKGNVDATGGRFSLDIMTNMIGRATVGAERPDLIITTQALWDAAHDIVMMQQRFATYTTTLGEQMAAVGFPMFSYMGADVVVDGHCPEGTMWFLNTKTFEFYVHQDRDFVLSPPEPIIPANRDERIWRVHFAGQLVCTSPRLNSVAYNLTP